MSNLYNLGSLAMVVILGGIGMGQESPLQIGPQIGRSSPAINPATPAAEKPNWLPKNKYPAIELSNLGFARMSSDGKAIQFIKPVTTTETFVKSVLKTVYHSETRQRTVKVGGQEQTIDYVVKVPSVVSEEVPYTAFVAAGVQKCERPLDKIRAWELSGKAIDSAELLKRLSKPTQVLVQELSVEELAEFKFQPVEPFFSGVIKLDTIAIYCPHEEPKPSE